MFKLLKKTTVNSVRAGNIETNHGVIKTPFFMPDATRGFIKAIGGEDLKKLNPAPSSHGLTLCGKKLSDIHSYAKNAEHSGRCWMKMGPMVVNTFHLYLQPGMPIIKKAGGIHKFMNWPGPLLSDSGGYQVFSLVHKNPKMGRITDKSVVFKSPLDGSRHELTPEKSIQIQFDLGVDMMVCLDDCPPNDFNKKDLEKSVGRTIAWAKRCRREYDKQVKSRKSIKFKVHKACPQCFATRGGRVKSQHRPLLFAVIQGGAEIDLRKYCAEELVKIGFDGYGFGARPVDKEGNFLGEVLKRTAEFIPENSLRFALGIGTPEDIVRCVSYGWDMFDCVIPTREGRHGRLFLWNNNVIASVSEAISVERSATGLLRRLRQPADPPRNDKKFYKTINTSNSKFSTDFSPINFDSKLPELRNHSKAYLNHLFKLKDPLGARLATLNNLEFYLELMERLKK